MASVMVRKNDQVMMSLVHYFVTKENYTPIHVQGVKDEIWLENLNAPYRIIRISNNTIINEEQYKFDIFKMQHIIKQIKKKTLSFKINALNICLDMDNRVLNGISDSKNISTIKVDDLDEVKNNQDIKDMFPGIEKELIESDDGLELLLNVTNDINEHTEAENQKFVKVFSPKKIVVTKILIALCIMLYFLVAVYGGRYFEFDANTLAYLGGNNIVLVKSGEIWRLLTSSFLHVGLVHLIVNMYSLAILGTQVETFIGKLKYIFIYLVSAIVASLFSLVFVTSNVVSVGASGAIFGLMGALLYFGYHYRLFLSDAIKNQIIPIIVINLLISFSFTGIDAAAHVGGLIGGYLAAMAIGIENKSNKKDMTNGWIVLILLVAFLSYIVFFVK